MYSGLHTKIRNTSVLLYFILQSSFTLSFHGASFSSSSSDISLLQLCSNRKFRYLYKSRPYACHLNNCEIQCVSLCAFGVSENSQFPTYRHRANTVLAEIITETATTVFKIGHQELLTVTDICNRFFKFAITAGSTCFSHAKSPQ